MKRIHLFILIFCSFTIFTACEDKTDINTSDLNGMWINKADTNDTIIFSNQMSEPTFEVKRGQEMQGENIVPKIGSGLYGYRLKNYTIYVNYMLLSTADKLPYHISINKEKNEFSVNGNFTYYPAEALQFTYRKVK